jgi:hypothetical protein
MSTGCIAFVTIGRPLLAQRFVTTARRYFPDLPIYVVDQTQNIGPMRDFYSAHQVRAIPIAFDSGLAAARNVLAKAIKEDYFLLCDDDFILGPQSNFQEAISVLEAFPDIGVVGGRLHDVLDDSERIRNWEMFFGYEARQGTFTATPIYNYAPITRRTGNVQVYMCDAVMNFAVYRTSMFDAGIAWDRRIKINGEHEDFFLNLKRNSSYRVAYLPSMAAVHQHLPLYPIYEAVLRTRAGGWKQFREKWGISQHLEIGTGGRPMDSGSPQDWFLASSAQRTDPLGLDVVERMPGQDVQDNNHAGVQFMRLRFTAETNCAAEVPIASLGQWAAELTESEHEPNTNPAAPVPQKLYFRYDPVRNRAADFVVWYWKASCITEEIRFRWFTADGRLLVWESEALQLSGHPGRRWWAPLCVAGQAHRKEAHDAFALTLTRQPTAPVLPADERAGFTLTGLHVVGHRFVSVDLGSGASDGVWEMANAPCLGRASFQFQLPPADGMNSARIVLPRSSYRSVDFRLSRLRDDAWEAARPLA